MSAVTFIPVWRRVSLLALTALIALSDAACSDSEEEDRTTTQTTAGQEIAGPGATEASPERPAQGAPASGELSETDRAAVAAAVDAYVAALDRRDAAAVCALFEPGALEVRELPRQRRGCAASLAASLGYRGPGGTPVWKRTTIQELNEVSVGPDRARVTATVLHRFADRRFPSTEEDVIYLDRSGEGWLLAKPSATLYRAVGYPEPPLRALVPPPE